MKRPLRDRRDAAADRHDAALSRYPNRQGAAFAAELRAVVGELDAVAHDADHPASDPVEVAKTYRWLGDAYFDLALGKDQDLLTRGSLAYQRCDELLADADAPVEQAKLDFNFGNTLRGLSGGFDPGLLEAAQTRYESAAKTFRSHHLPQLAATVDQQLRTIDPQIRLARKQAGLKRGHDRLVELQRKVKDENAVERERIARELKELRKIPAQGDIAEALTEVRTGLDEQFDEHPERFVNGGGQLEALAGQFEEFTRILEPGPTADREGATGAGPDALARTAMTQLLDRLRKERAAGTVSDARAQNLAELLKEFSDVTAGDDDDDVDAMARRARKMRDILKKAMDFTLTPSWTSADLEPGSRADRIDAVLEGNRRYLIAEKGRAMLPAEETAQGTDLLMRLMTLRARIREVVQDGRALDDAENSAWRLAVAVQEHARRHHLMLAQPIFAGASPHVDPRSVFLSGGDDLVAAARLLERREGLQTLAAEGRGDLAQERWNQLCAASVAVFDLGVPPGAARAQACYELGLAFALGKPTVVAVRPRQRLPFNVDLRPVQLTGDAATDAGGLMAGIEEALGEVVWGGGDSARGGGAEATIAWLDARLGRRLADGALKIAADLARDATGDAVAFHRSLDQLLGMLGGNAPVPILPAWPPAYPDPAARPRLFHVMPFRPKWAPATRDLAAGVCESNKWIYTRGDESREQRVIRGIWTEIARASAVLIDLTGLNPNVALELGLTHALGRPFRIVAQGKAERHMFASLAKVQVHGYGKGTGYRGFADEVTELLADADG